MSDDTAELLAALIVGCVWGGLLMTAALALMGRL